MASRQPGVAATIGTTADFTNDYVYDYLNRLQSINQYDTAGGNVVADKRVVLRYRLNNDLNVIHRYADLGGTLQVASGTFGYDTQGRLTSLDYVQGSTNLTAYDWTYNQLNQVATFAMDVAGTTVDGTATYNYYDRTDGVRVEPGQIQSATYSPGFQASEAYSYDATGNRTMSGYSTGPMNRMTSDGVFNYIYDGEGNRDLRTRISGAPANDYTTDYDWDYQNRLTKVTFKNNSGVVTKTVEYGYDPWNNLVWRSVDADGAGPGTSVKTYFVNDGTEAVLALSPTGAVKDRYLWAPTIDQVMADEQPGTGELLWTFTDNLGTVRELARYTGGVTSVANHRVFDSYGQLKSETNAAVDHLFAFTGRMLDEDTGLQQHLNRWYDPKVGRWLSEDPIGFDAGDVNVYRYVGNEVTGRIDPEGLTPKGPKPGPNNLAGLVASLPDPPQYWLIAAVIYNPGARNVGALGGHSWIAAADSKADTLVALGFYPTQDVTRRNDSCPGQLQDDSFNECGVARAYPITKEQYDQLVKSLTDAQKNPPQYDLADYNCTTWAIEIASGVIGGINVPSATIQTGENDPRRPDYSPGDFGRFLCGDNRPGSQLLIQPKDHQ